MNPDIKREYGEKGPRVIVLDDERRVREAAVRELIVEGFDVTECVDIDAFKAKWAPGHFDLIIADWDLSNTLNGDDILEHVRKLDWDVPFILVSGRLEEDDKKSEVFGSLLESGGADFVKRGDDGIKMICEKAANLLLKRDLALLRLVLSFRESALSGKRIKTSSGLIDSSDVLAELVRNPIASHDGERPIAERIKNRIQVGLE